MKSNLSVAFALCFFLLIEARAASCNFEDLKNQLDLICNKISTTAMEEINGQEINRVSIFDICGMSQAAIYSPKAPDYSMLNLPLRPWLNGASNSAKLDNEGKNAYAVIAEQLANDKVKYGETTVSDFFINFRQKRRLVARKCLTKNQESVIVLTGLYELPDGSYGGSQSLNTSYSIISSQEYLDSIAVTENANPDATRALLTKLIDKTVSLIDYKKINQMINVDEKLLKEIFRVRGRRFLSAYTNEDLNKSAPLFLFNLLEQIDQELNGGVRLRKLVSVQQRTIRHNEPAVIEKRDVKMVKARAIHQKQIADVTKLKNIYGFKLQNVIIAVGIVSLFNLIGLIILLIKL